MVEVERDTTHIVPLTYGVMPRYADRSQHRLTVDSALAATAAQELYSRLESDGQKTQIFIPGATFFHRVTDAQSMRWHITNPGRPEAQRVPWRKVTISGNCLNTPTQFAQVKEMQRRGELGKVALICASWQEDDAKVLMQNYHIKGTLFTDQDILLDNKRHKNTFAKQAETDVYKLKKDGLQARIFRRLNKIDRKGMIRVVLSKILGVGIADWEYRGLASRAMEWLDRRQDRIQQNRRLQNSNFQNNEPGV